VSVGVLYVGTMSGTSLDGVTAAAVRFTEGPAGEGVTLLAQRTRPYDEAVRARLAAAMRGGVPPAEIVALAATVADATADAALAVMAAAGVDAAQVAAVAVHGQTLWHAPPLGSWQLVDASRVAERTGCAVVHDFRARDLAAGGQGAPLVPLADAMLFGATDGARALQNLGGMANVTVVPRRGETGTVQAFDTGPGVAVIDAVVQACTGAPFDRDGALAAQGRPIEALLAPRLAEPYFAAPPPKSTGRERFGAAYVEALLRDARALAPAASTADLVATATALTVRSIADAYARFVRGPLVDVLVSGGGAHNRTLMAGLAAALPVPLRRFDEVWFAGDAKEAVAFAYLAWRHDRGLPGNVPTATGAHGPRVLGSRVPA
jgi:anhydro-N-acetylmuramic acid kinase